MKSQGISPYIIKPVSKSAEVSLYEISTKDTANRYCLLSGQQSRRLLAYPEVVSLDAYQALLAPTETAFRYLLKKGNLERPEICTILRGGLNYPLEEACHHVGLPVANIHFLSCERIIENDTITGLEVKYDKLTPTDGATLMFGDILASGMTFSLCVHRIVDAYKEKGCRLRRIIFFTIGGTRAVDLFDGLTSELRSFWPEFEGIDCFFYEGVFSVYEDKGVLGFQVPLIDFCWNGGLIAPEYRLSCMEQLTPVLEKCVIYDGGARRYNIPEHRAEVLEYWEKVRQHADDIDLVRLLDERMGYPATNDFDKWLEYTGYQLLDTTESHQILASEINCRKKLAQADLRALAQDRIDGITRALSIY